ncbi:hypothetical protein N8368_02000 [Bacteroidia bacterium]|nr:hypothetical protein [Bacteroidia bacterium]MDC1395262.1 hypothetical protein [Bacteroidia bacterium]
MKHLFALPLLLVCTMVHGQTAMDSFSNYHKNATRTLLESKEGNLLMGAYGEVHYEQPFGNNSKYNGAMDAERMVLLFGYKFDSKTSFISEIEIEHIKEVYLEQAFLNYQAKPWLNVQAGLLLIPMGLMNEYHEPTIFNGVNRPTIANALYPSTWREIGAGFAGNIPNAALRYQLYAVNGPMGYNNEAKLDGNKPLRGARQKGAQVTMTAPDLSAKINYYGIKGVDIGLAGYFGTTESNLYNNIDRDSAAQLLIADSSVIGIQMIGLDFRYQSKKFQAKGELFYSKFSNTDAYNTFTNRDLGSSIFGYYGELGYDISSILGMKKKLVPFVRYSEYNTHQSISSGMIANKAYDRSVLTTGFSFFLNESVVVKADYQNFSDANSNQQHQFNSGIGFWFR